MLYLLDMNKGCKILEIGTGSGWNAALVAWLVKPSKIITAERIPELTEFAKSNFKELIKSEKLKLNLEFVCGNAFDGKSKIWKQKYDRIIVTAGASSELSIQLENLAKALLKEKGLLLYPTSGDWGALELLQFEHKKLKKICSESGYVFVPLIKK
jgi:protein-L-isoaspartate(D-aspartate) O-methyltransferase